MAYGKIIAGVLELKQSNPEAGFVVIPDDAICGQVTTDKGKTFKDPPPPEPTVDDFHEALYKHFDATAQADRWDNRQTLLQRAAFPGQWQPLALAFGAWINECEVFALDLLAEVQAGTKPAPKSKDAFLALLPPFTP